MRKTLHAYTAPSAICMSTPATARIDRLGVSVFMSLPQVQVHDTCQPCSPQTRSVSAAMFKYVTLCRHALTKACLKEFRSASPVNKRHVQVLATALHSKSHSRICQPPARLHSFRFLASAAFLHSQPGVKSPP